MRGEKGAGRAATVQLESLHAKANSVIDDSLESTRRMLAMCEEVSRVAGRAGFISSERM